ncbi:MAG: alpha/beta hydrolase [Caldilineaceae bacterium]|nr:alpha/beta hydrolase [Caldilineaceae bacterium]
MRLAGFLTLNAIGAATYARHVLGRRMEPTWDAGFETGIRFWRQRFTEAMRCGDMARGRQLFDSVQTETDDIYDVSIEACDRPKGRWYTPGTRLCDAMLLYFHGGGYAFHAAASRRFAAMLAHHCGARLFAPDYRLTPEHPHPAQAEDALAAWRHVASSTPAGKLVVIGDSAGGHMALTLLQTLKSEGLPQPALCIGLCPWTDVGDRGASLRGNDRYDLVQGWMALRFGEWLDPDGRYGREALSPISHDYSGLAPIYLQAGGREVLRDMIRDFATVQAARGADVLLDLWPDMPHDFQAFDTVKQSSSEALARICAAVMAFACGAGSFCEGPNTVVSQGVFSRK